MPKPELELFFEKNIEDLPQVVRRWVDMDHANSLSSEEVSVLGGGTAKLSADVARYKEQLQFLAAIQVVNRQIRAMQRPEYYEVRASIQEIILTRDCLGPNRPLSEKQRHLCTVSYAADLMRGGRPSNWFRIAALFGEVGMQAVEKVVMTCALGKEAFVSGERATKPLIFDGVEDRIMTALSLA